MINWSDYGKLVAVYRGDGQLRFSGDKANCSFELVQFTNGNLFALCQVSKSIGLEQTPVELTGKTEDGRNLTFSGKLRITHLEADKIVVLGQFVTVSDGLSAGAPNRFTFGVTNMFLPARQLSLEVGDHAIVIRRVSKHSEIVRAVKASNGTDVTCEILVQADSTSDREAIKKTIDDLCLLLTLAFGYRVAWLYYHLTTLEEQPIESFHGNAITGRFVCLPLIDVRSPPQITRFVEAAYEHLQKAEEYWELRKAVDAYTDAKAEGVFLEARALQLVVVMEHLRSRYLVQEQKTFILQPPEVFDRSIEPFRKAVLGILAYEYPDVDQDRLAMMASHVQGLNWYPFSCALSEICVSVGLSVNSRERRRFVNIRNGLVHQFAFPSDYGTPWDRFSFVMTFIGKVLLAILKYDGVYFDWTKLDQGEGKMKVRLKLTAGS